MLNWKRVALITTIGITISFAALPEPCQAHWLRDWLEYRRCIRAQRRTFFRDGLFGGGLYRSLCQPSCQTSQRTVVRYVPQVAYRTVWQRVPVTVYRPVTATDPCTCCRTVSYRPCTTHQWQAQRVAYTTYRPVATTVAVPAPSCCNTVGASAVHAATPTYSVAAPSSGCSTCAPSTSPFVPAPVQPGYGPAIIQSPNNLEPTQIVPGTGGQGITVPSSPGIQTTPPSDADVQPSLPQNQFQSGIRIQESNPRVGLDYISPRRTTPAYGTGLMPIPNLDSEDSNDAPRLINPHDRTASSSSIRLVGGYSKIDGSVPSSEEQLEKKSSEPTQWDDHGWESARH